MLASVAQVTVLDLDLKSVAKVESHLELEKDIMACAAQHPDVLADLLRQQQAPAASSAESASCVSP